MTNSFSTIICKFLTYVLCVPIKKNEVNQFSSGINFDFRKQALNKSILCTEINIPGSLRAVHHSYSAVMADPGQAVTRG